MSGIIYRGPSLIDNEQIVVVAIAKSGNRKTGDMIQTYILRDGVDPRMANQQGLDISICGNCPHRGIAREKQESYLNTIPLAHNRTCYVNLGQGPTIVFKGLERGIYPKLSDDEAAELARGRMVRIGTYGDGAAVPAYVWRNLLRYAAGHTAYTHQSGLSPDPSLYMTSADTEEQARKAWKEGKRTFRIVASVDNVLKDKEIVCPASKEGGYRTTCAHCGLCNGTSSKARKSVAIVVHGSGAKYFA